MRRGSLGWLAIAAALAGGIGGGRFGGHFFPRLDKRYGGRFGPYKPHQSTRECARRVGGEAWAAFKSADRERRGLPA